MTICGSTPCRAGCSNAATAPTTAESAKTGQTIVTSAAVSTTYTAATVAATAVARKSSRRGSIRSATTPPSNVRKTPGSVWMMSAPAMAAARSSGSTRWPMNSGTTAIWTPTPSAVTTVAVSHAR